MKIKKLIQPKVIAKREDQYLISALWVEYDALALAVIFDDDRFGNYAPLGLFLKFDPYWEVAPVAYTPSFDIPNDVIAVLNMTVEEFKQKYGATFPQRHPE